MWVDLCFGGDLIRKFRCTVVLQVDTLEGDLICILGGKGTVEVWQRLGQFLRCFFVGRSGIS